MYVCQIAPYISYPPRRGGDHRTHGIIKEFPSSGDTVIRYCQGGTPETYKSLNINRRIQIAKDYEERRHLHPVHEMAKAPMLLGYPNALASNALRTASDGLVQMLTRADVIFVREPWQMSYVFDKVPSDTPVVFSSHNVEKNRFDDISQPFFEDKVLHYVEKAERQAVTQADAVICTSHQDAKRYENIYETDTPMIIAPNGTYKKHVREHHSDSLEAKQIRHQHGISADTTVCLFIGSNYQPNAKAAESIFEIARNMNQKAQQVHFFIIGSVDKSLNEKLAPSNVTITGYIDEKFESYFDAADIALNPVQVGGGTNIKLFDYFARSLPVLTTPFGMRGINAKPGQHLITANLDEFADEIESLAEAACMREQLGTAGCELIADQYTWEASSQHIRDRITDIFNLS